MGELIGYARCSTVLQDLATQSQALAALGVPDDRIYLDKGLTGSSRARPGLDQALAGPVAGKWRNHSSF
jgi:DNA invertase Pin-like site-specific DNA recombinase